MPPDSFFQPIFLTNFGKLCCMEIQERIRTFPGGGNISTSPDEKFGLPGLIKKKSPIHVRLRNSYLKKKVF